VAIRRYTLQEYSTEVGVPLSRDEVLGIGMLAPSIAIAPSARGEGRFDLTPGSFVGAIRLGDVAIEIRPKIDIRHVLFLISYAVDPARWNQQSFDMAPEPSLVEAVVPSFVRQVRQAFHRGILRGYRSVEESLPTIRGRLRFDDQLRRRFGLFPPIEVRYDEYSEDIQENRLIKAAAVTLQQLALRSMRVLGELRGLMPPLEAVSLVEYGPRTLPEILYTRLNEHYRPAVELARLILRSSAFDLHHGSVRATAFLVDMNVVFEDFVVVALREALGVSAREFPQGAKGRALYLDQEKRVTLKPDLSWWEGGHCRFVGDAKYKRTHVQGAPNADLYQLLAYTMATGLPGGLLVYAAGEEEPRSVHVREARKVIEVVALDLAVESRQLLSQIAALARRVRQWRDASQVLVA
jgi:5-methylcytosine-specific restriction enzyme subunit McrC